MCRVSFIDSRSFNMVYEIITNITGIHSSRNTTKIIPTGSAALLLVNIERAMRPRIIITVAAIAIIEKIMIRMVSSLIILVIYILLIGAAFLIIPLLYS